MKKLVKLKDNEKNDVVLEADSIVLDNSRNCWVNPKTTTLNGITLTKKENGALNISGTASSDTNIVAFIDLNETDIINGKTYTLTTNKTLPNGMGIKFENYQDSTWKSFILGGGITHTNRIRTGTAKIEGNKVRFGVYVQQGTIQNISDLKVYVYEETAEKTTLKDYLNDMWLVINSK